MANTETRDLGQGLGNIKLGLIVRLEYWTYFIKIKGFIMASINSSSLVEMNCYGGIS